jgi:hypothetical protein
MTIPGFDPWWADYQYTDTARCEVLTCCCKPTHVLHLDDDEIRLCDFHIGKFALISMSLQRHAGCQVAVARIGQAWQAEQERLRYEGE